MCTFAHISQCMCEIYSWNYPCFYASGSLDSVSRGQVCHLQLLTLSRAKILSILFVMCFWHIPSACRSRIITSRSPSLLNLRVASRDVNVDSLQQPHPSSTSIPEIRSRASFYVVLALDVVFLQASLPSSDYQNIRWRSFCRRTTLTSIINLNTPKDSPQGSSRTSSPVVSVSSNVYLP